MRRESENGKEEGRERRRGKEIGWANGEREGGEMLMCEKRQRDGREEGRERRRRERDRLS
jgi:hypothetical protein